MALRAAPISFSTPFANDPTRLVFASVSQLSSFATTFEDQRLKVIDQRSSGGEVRNVALDRRDQHGSRAAP